MIQQSFLGDRKLSDIKDYFLKTGEGNRHLSKNPFLNIYRKREKWYDSIYLNKMAGGFYLT